MMARKEDQALIDQLDYAIDCMNVETPNWRTELYNQYYGSVENNRELTDAERALLHRLLEDGETIRAVMNPDANPYSWYEDGEARGIAADIFRAAAEEPGLHYEIVPVSTREEYESVIASGGVDIWMDMDSSYEEAYGRLYKATAPYLSTTVSVLRVRGAADKIATLVTDDGIGMSEDFVQHICEDYTRAEDSRVSKTQGTDLGMSVVKGFTDLMGGTLSIQSELGHGSAFAVEFPFPPATEEERRALAHSAAETEPKAPEYAGRKVLLVEDNALNAEIAKELLHIIGLTVDWAENGELGLERFEASAPGEYFAVFMDIQMPVMDGCEATRRIRAMDRPDAKTVQIVAMTANAFAEDVVKCKEAGMDAHLPKPFKADQLIASIVERGE